LTAIKFWLIASIPVLFICYNYMRKRKRIVRKHQNFYLSVILYSFFSIISAVFIVFIFSANIQVVNSLNQPKVTGADAAALNQAPDKFNQVMREVEDYTRQHIAALAPNNDAGDSSAVLDEIDFIGADRALVRYHDNSDQYLAEEIFSDNNRQIDISRFILKVKDGVDFSGGSYGGN